MHLNKIEINEKNHFNILLHVVGVVFIFATATLQR